MTCRVPPPVALSAEDIVLSEQAGGYQPKHAIPPLSHKNIRTSETSQNVIKEAVVNPEMLTSAVKRGKEQKGGGVGGGAWGVGLGLGGNMPHL